MKNLFPLLALVLMFSCTEPHQLQLNLKKGETYHQNLVSEINMKQEFNGQKMDINMSVEGKMAFEVLEEKGDKYETKVRYESMKMSMQSPFGVMEFNSVTKDDSNPMNSIFSKMTASSFTVEMNKLGEISSVTGVNELFESILSEFDSIPEAQKNQILKQVKESFGENAMKSNIEMGTAIFPDKPVMVNDTWTKKINLTSTFSSDVNTSFVLKEHNGDNFIISGNGTIASNESSTEQNDAINNYKLDGTFDSELIIDAQTGWISTATITQNLKGSIDMNGGMTIPVEIINKMTITGK